MKGNTQYLVLIGKGKFRYGIDPIDRRKCREWFRYTYSDISRSNVSCSCCQEVRVVATNSREVEKILKDYKKSEGISKPHQIFTWRGGYLGWDFANSIREGENVHQKVNQPKGIYDKENNLLWPKNHQLIPNSNQIIIVDEPVE